MVAALPETPATPPALEGRQLILAVQTELNRIGCYPGTIDGDWGNMSRRAVEAFNDSAGVAVAATEPTLELLDTLKSRSTVVCSVQPDTVAVGRATRLDRRPHAMREDRRPGERPRSQRRRRGTLRSRAIPSPTSSLSELTTRTQIRCDDTFTCSLRIRPTSEMVSLSIVDYDRVKANELMGEGQCRIGGKCTFPDATVSMSGC